MNLNGYQRIDLHNHSTISDGKLKPLDVLQHAIQLGFKALALTDHVFVHNVEEIVQKLLRAQQKAQAQNLPIQFIPGVEVSLVPPEEIASVARRARQAGAALVLVHGEAAWVGAPPPGTNLAAAQCPEVDFIGHPGFLSEEAARAAAENNVMIELSGREIYSLTNGYLAKMAQQFGNKLIVGSDAHVPQQMLTLDRAEWVARGAGLDEEGVYRALVTNPEELLARVRV